MRRALLILAVIAGTIGFAEAAHAAPCPVAACITISGRVIGPKGEAVPDYRVIVQRSDGYNAQMLTTSAGTFAAEVPSGSCYQIVGQADSFYANSNVSWKPCSSASVNLYPKYRMQSFHGQQKNYIHDSSVDVTVTVEAQVLSRTHPAPFANDPVPYRFMHDMPGHDHNDHHHSGGATMDGPYVDQIAAGVWRYIWRTTVTLWSDQPGYYDVDFGRGASPYDPMMECRMYWFGYGLAKLSSDKAVPGQTVTITGQRLGSERGVIQLKGSGQVTTISGSAIVEWSDTKITFVVPPLAKTGYVSAIPPTGIVTNELFLNLDPVKVPIRT